MYAHVRERERARHTLIMKHSLVSRRKHVGKDIQSRLA